MHRCKERRGKVQQVNSSLTHATLWAAVWVVIMNENRNQKKDRPKDESCLDSF